MDDQTIQRLNAMNRQFYETTAAEFDQTRGQPWPGWTPLLDVIRELDLEDDKLTVLDVGCGNGRFGVFLAENLDLQIDYHGLDNNAALLDFARSAFTDLKGFHFMLEQRDVVLNLPESGAYDLVVAFGLLHHIPGGAERQAFVRTLAQKVNPGGLLAFACWRFYDFARFRERIVPWPDDLVTAVEAHDYLLDWRRGETALRYCHYVDDAEHTALVTASGLESKLSYFADGFTGTVNLYSILGNLT